MNKKNSIVTLVIAIVVALAIGVGIGYLITKNINNNQIVKEVSSTNMPAQTQTEKSLENKTENNETNSIIGDNLETNIVQTPKYDGSKDFVINGKVYTISYKNELKEEQDKDISEEDRDYTTTIYLNNKKVKTFNSIGAWKLEDTDLNYSNCNLTTIKSDKEYIVMELTISPTPSDYDSYMVIFNENEEILDIVKVHESNVGISIDGIYSHKIYENYIIFFKNILERGEAPITKDGTEYSVAVYKITVENDEVNYILERLCVNDEVAFSGK